VVATAVVVDDAALNALPFMRVVGAPDTLSTLRLWQWHWSTTK